MNPYSWILLDTEVNGISSPIYAVEIAAQKMQGWLPKGKPFRRLLNHNADLSPEASRVNGYTREILERDGEEPLQVYQDLAEYAGGLPLVSYNLAFDWDKVLLPEWQRLGLAPIGQRGFCALELARRLLDPVPAGNCKLQTLRQYYRLPERGAHTALGDVQTVVDLLEQVLHPLAQARGIASWGDVLAFTTSEWFPAKIAFGKYKGRNFREAATDEGLRQWLHWLADSSTERSARMGQWYLQQLAQADAGAGIAAVAACADSGNPGAAGSAVVVYLSPQKAELEALIQAARERLAEVEAAYTEEKHAVDVTLARLFQALRPQYQRRDSLKLRNEYRRRFLDTLMTEGEEQAEEVEQEHRQAQQESSQQYEQAAAEAEGKQELTAEEAREVKQLWRKLVKDYHPDRCVDDEEKREAHEWLTAEINQARDRGDIAMLREIAQDPDDFLQKHGMATLARDDAEESLERLRGLLDALQQRILEALEATNALRATPGHELHQRCQQDPAFFDTAVANHQQQLAQEIAALEQEGQRLAEEIENLTGVAPEGD